MQYLNMQQTCKRLNVSYHQLDYAMERGYVQPSFCLNKIKVFSEADLPQIKQHFRERQNTGGKC
jgi:DNA-binding transcriptional MerR regulator